MPIRGPGVMLSQFMGGEAPFDSLDGVVGWLAGFGYKGVQIPVHDPRLIDLPRAATDDAKARDFLDRIRKAACSPFTTVLGPGSDADHATHFHFDLAKRRNGSTFCQ